MHPEFNPFAKRYRKGVRRVALLYPNRYVGGIANVGLQYIYAAINELENYVCERFYADVFGGMRSVESGTPLKDFDLVLVSLQYELDVFKAVEILRKSGFRGLKIAGGPCVMQNPLPFKPFFDAFFVGEVEGKLEEIVSAKSVDDLKGLPGVYTGEEESVKRVYANLGKHMDLEIIGEGAYGRCFLVEIGRGCVRLCNFCVVRGIYFPPRWRKLEDLPEVKNVDKVALIAPSPTDHPRFADIVQLYVEKGLRVSPSSLRADALTEELAELLSKTSRSLTLAPETASPRLLEVVNKGITPEDVLRAAEVASGRFEKLKLYYLVGLPGEEEEDVEAIVEQAKKVKRLVKRVEVSVNPLVPKPHTPMQWFAFRRDAGKKIRKIVAACRKEGIEVDAGSVREFELQTIISRGDESVSKLISGEKRPRDFERFLGSFEIDKELPWDFLDHRYSKARLKKEYERILSLVENR
ncbi:MAG: radical SAM protein [Archaeoglobaceae archaeon]